MTRPAMLLAIAALLLACGGRTSPPRDVEPAPTRTATATASDPIAAPTPAATLAAEAVEVSGTGTESRPFELGGGDYVVTIEQDGDDCFLAGASLKPVGGSPSEWRLMTGLDEGEEYLNGVEAGEYFLSVHGSCPWTVTLDRAR